MPLNIDYDSLKSLSDAVESAVDSLKSLSDAVESAVDSLLNSFEATTPSQEKTIIKAVESLAIALAEINRLRGFESYVEERWS